MRKYSATVAIMSKGFIERIVRMTCHTSSTGRSACSLATSRPIDAATGYDASGVDFRPIHDAERDLRDDVQRIVDCPLLPPGTVAAGFVYDVDTGTLSRSTPQLGS